MPCKATTVDSDAAAAAAAAVEALKIGQLEKAKHNCKFSTLGVPALRRSLVSQQVKNSR
jgi:hypothetical protein